MSSPAGLRAVRPSRSKRLCSTRSEEHTSELQSLRHLVCRLLLEKKKKKKDYPHIILYTASYPSSALTVHCQREAPRASSGPSSCRCRSFVRFWFFFFFLNNPAPPETSLFPLPAPLPI